MAEMLIVKSKLKTANPELNVAGDLADALNNKVVALLKEAGERAVANGRKTIKFTDL
jgi:histone H3/H4